MTLRRLSGYFWARRQMNRKMSTSESPLASLGVAWHCARMPRE